VDCWSVLLEGVAVGVAVVLVVGVSVFGVPA
jgi:hypothetical protein